MSYSSVLCVYTFIFPETQKFGNKTSSGEIGLDIWTYESPKVYRTRCPEEWASSVGMPHPLHMFYGHLAQLSKKSNSVIRFRSVTVKNWCNFLSIGCHCIWSSFRMPCNIRERGDLILFGQIPVPAIELPKRRFQTFLYISLPENRTALRIKHS